MTDDPAPDTITTPDQLDARQAIVVALAKESWLRFVIAAGGDAGDPGMSPWETYEDDTEAQREAAARLRESYETKCGPFADAVLAALAARGSADSETLRAQVERQWAFSRNEMDMVRAERDTARTEAAMWRERAEVGRGMVQNACTEAATLRGAIEGLLPIGRGLVGDTWLVTVLADRYDDLRAVLAAHPAPEAAPPTQVDPARAWDEGFTAGRPVEHIGHRRPTREDNPYRASEVTPDA